MFWFALFTVVVAGVFIDSFRLFFLGLLFMSIKAFPRIMLPLIGATIAWAVKNLRR